MLILRNIQVPTGNILIVEGEKGKLEMLSLGDYGKDVNLKCDSMGLSRELARVQHGTMLPLTEKWVLTISTQYGCSMGCTFCDVPKVGVGLNATLKDMQNQIATGLSLHPEVAHTDRLNIHFARMGEPAWNINVLDAAYWLHAEVNSQHKVHPVVSTIMPRGNAVLKTFISEWLHIKNQLFEGNAGLQISINSTSFAQRLEMFNGNALDFPTVAVLMKDTAPVGRKYTLNFAIAGYEIDPEVLLRYFNPEHYIIKLTPMHKTALAIENGIETEGDYTTYHPYKADEERLKAAGYDVLVFIASEYEDLGRITCGNAILSGTMPLCPHEELVVT